MPLADNIKKFRELRDMNIPQLADKIGAKKQSVYDWEKGKYAPGKEYIDLLAKVLGVEVKDFYGDGEVMTDKSGAVEGLQHAPESVYRDLIEKNTEYRLIPKTILDEEYRIILKSEIELKEQMLKNLLDAKNDLIEQLKQEISELRLAQRAVTAK